VMKSEGHYAQNPLLGNWCPRLGAGNTQNLAGP
jgi:hypothetical protein